MSYITDLETRRDNVAAELAELDATKAGGLPNVLHEDGGTTIDHEKYKAGLYAELKRINELIADYYDKADGPFEESSYGVLGW